MQEDINQMSGEALIIDSKIDISVDHNENFELENHSEALNNE